MLKVRSIEYPVPINEYQCGPHYRMSISPGHCPGFYDGQNIDKRPTTEALCARDHSPQCSHIHIAGITPGPTAR